MINAGQISKTWLDNARSNEVGEETVEVWLARTGNWRAVEIDTAGSVWVEGPCAGRWLSQDEIDAACEQIDRGV